MPSQEEANIARVRHFYELIAQGDRDGAYAETFAPDCELFEAAPLPYGGHYRGRDTVRDVLAGVVARFDAFEVDIRNYLGGADEVVVHLHLDGVGREGRRPFSVDVLELWRFRDGKAIELRPFLFDPLAVAAALP